MQPAEFRNKWLLYTFYLMMSNGKTCFVLSVHWASVTQQGIGRGAPTANVTFYKPYNNCVDAFTLFQL